METVVVIDGNDRRRYDDSELENSAYSTPLHEQIADPVVYKLVRVEGDGRLVPATDDEIMEVVDLLKDEKSDMDIVDTCEENVTSSTCGSFGRKTVLDTSGYCESVKAEEEKIDLRQEAAPCSGSRDNNLSGLAVESSKPPGSSKEEAPTIALCDSLKPDFSKLKGDICLDNLSIRDLHETFRATFGRGTTVKDKTWLKRRISMGLANSCDISTITFSIKDGKALKLSKEGTSTCIPYPIAFPRNRVRDEHSKDSAVQSTHQVEDCQVVSEKRVRNRDPVDGSESDALHQEDATAAKRIRKPTKRYIEELSELETLEQNGRLLNSSKGSEQLSPKFGTVSARNVSSGGKITRLDSLSGIRVPCVSRIRRSRPRKDIMSLSKFYRKMGEAANFGKPFDKRSYQSAAESEKDHARSNFTLKQVQLLEDPDEQCLVMDEIELEHKDCTIMDPGSSEDIPNGNITTVPTSKGGMRRKHHRAWTLSEVIKLVEGVSKYGVGRWSEIKRLSFASFSYRTSVDLKDKWRNLLKAASFSSSPTDLMNSRKHAVTPIPGPILSRIRELTEKNGQPLSPNLISLKVASDCPSGATQTGFL